MARSSPASKASTRLPSQMASHGPSSKPSMPPVKKPAKSNLGAKIKRTSDQPKGSD